MRSAAFVRAPRMRGWMFAVCAGCTLWLVIQNVLLVTLVGWARLLLPAALATAGQAFVIGAVLAAVVPLSFLLGWMAARGVPTASRSRGECHD